MPNRKKDVGWYRLRSGTPYHGPVPEGAERLSDAEVKKLGSDQYARSEASEF